ncbi:MAG: DUF6080 domain-containing protein [Bacteroidales bacterium]|nr:DUF6080 domain-containing protein [Bacteroidales bacterium]MCM1148371.1 DUF6080 domain-containing protein [Bacteroidales bacterium]MCM1207044.1 DUF6080 domain-containing protein [Bacillota bacterium]MCM1511315.1 DUF6080 domain-containing protein [Clostridium sp.]
MKPKHRETLLAALLGLAIFALLNYLMVQWHEEPWTNPKMGYWSIFRKYFCLSGFDAHTYVTISKWRPLYELYRHPMLSLYMWPPAWINSRLNDIFHINCAIYTVAVMWTMISTATWVLLYRLMRDIVNLSACKALLMCLFHYSFSHVMLAAIAPDHMIITQFLLILTLFLATRRGEGMPAWQALTLFFVSAGVSLTNGIKIWLIDIASHISRHTTFGKELRRSLLYIIPTLMLGAMYILQTETTEKEEHRWQVTMRDRRIERDTTYLAKLRADSLRQAKERSRQTTDSKLFQWTDNSVERIPLLVENFFGEGLILHEDHLLEDANLTENPRPVIIHYNNPWEYIAEGTIVALFALGLFCGRRKRLMWAALLPFLFDMMLHVGMRFAASDVYIMTAHWAFVIPIAVAYLVKRVQETGSRPLGLMLSAVILTLTATLWWHNASLIAGKLLDISL